MADLGFLPGVRRLLAATPARGQRLLFSATLDNGVDQIVQRFLSMSTAHSVDSAEAPIAALTHHVFTVDGAETKRAVVQHLASGVAYCSPGPDTRPRGSPSSSPRPGSPPSACTAISARTPASATSRRSLVPATSP